MPDTRATSSRGCCEDVARVWRVGRLPRSACLVGQRSAAVYSAARLSVCRVVLQIPRPRHTRLVSGKTLASLKIPRPTRLTRLTSSSHVSDILTRMSRGCYEETASMEFQLYDTLTRDKECRVSTYHITY